jgi:hypothetical protein
VEEEKRRGKGGKGKQKASGVVRTQGERNGTVEEEGMQID